ncbi:hypothetical protein VST7929_01549 [Vibrio stylophorae]|uniref:Uncharacterized protein n=1 Tax=Vibrio stylophorae TaxID=659351 RepID=A0ABN8DSZ4_9VIBR|nr:hypothetical protein [Vibrio stylophorae]CAH0533678.1 hypothetical protein VST7929_01549 [Vibrio stylophorae]
MNRKSTLALLALFTLSTPALAAGIGIKAKAAQSQAQERIQTEVAQVAQSCGNATLTATIDWSAWSGYDYSTERMDGEKAARWTSGVINNIYNDMINLCTKHEYASAYKAELSKITTINFSGHADFAVRDTAFKLSEDGTVLNVTLNGNGAYNSKFANFLEAVWE